jgi:hypothetical protein
MTAAILSGDALAAIRHRGSSPQIITLAGSGKIEVVASVSSNSWRVSPPGGHHRGDDTRVVLPPAPAARTAVRDVRRAPQASVAAAMTSQAPSRAS